MKQNNPKNINTTHFYRFDAKGKTLGRISTEVSMALQGKLLPDYSPEKLSNVRVIIQNVAQVAVSGKKMSDKKYFRFTGYPGGIKSKSMEELFKKDPEQFFIRVVRNMLPNNRLRNRMIKKIQFKR
ncbi:MAG: 50S ribosomal protein L13 [Candidatus Kerfeldbacteria bacterium CG_4_10_14_0_8_um_filter_42_10]|uniref:50S ribosomal protein L13 n=1 Tax=Candidatus Kerfeldbacteria bacterium CG_4_10_14_0_8_um_filter_42_10 TaxID=2014248 RepID=A0A2M7RIF6_9BACT|nr:MAG: 50S ribosomal protein L13 [Candidatus Kerfeldbacteria bacterium CG_4_10_14_0_8_um_filter_42_10]